MSFQASPAFVVVMGVAGCGKSSLGSALAQAEGLPLIEGDDHHSPTSREKMRQGIALTDADREGWLTTLGQLLQAQPQGAVLTCSALKKVYRDRLRNACPGLRFVFLEIDRASAGQRVAARAGTHFFSSALVDSQFATLESPVGEAGVLRLDALLDLPTLQQQASACSPAQQAVPQSRFARVSQVLMASCLGVMAVAVFINVVLRYGFGSGVAASEELSRLLFVWMVFIGAAAAYPAGEHMAFTSLAGLLAQRPVAFGVLTAVIRLLVMAACAMLAWGAWQQVVVGMGSRSVVMAYPAALLPLPAFLSLAFVVFSLGMLVLMGTGMNMGLALVLTGAGMAWVLDFWDAQLLAQNLVAGVDSFPLLAVPFFILAGELMNSGGISRRIIDMAQAWVGHIRGGLGYVAIGAAVLMASMSGSALADTAALATILLPMMRQQGYPMNTSAGLIASGGIIAPIIPPSMPFVIYGVTTNTSISALFVSGIVPGLMMGVGLIFAWRWVLRGMDLPQGEPLPIKDRLRATVRAFWAMLMPLIIIGGMKTGVFTPTEAAVVAAFYALVVALFIHREMKLADIYGVLVRAAKTTSIVMFLCAGAQVASYMITLADLPNVLTNWLGPLVENPRLLMAVMMIVLVLIGTALDLTPTILIFAPVMLPIAVKAGIDPVYFGLMFVLNGAIGLITPPVGTVLNVVAGVGRISMHSVIKGVNPFLITYVLILALLVVFPQIVTAPVVWLR
eukprot:gene1004-984_t